MTSEHTPEPWKVFKSADGTKLLGVGSAETAMGITDYKGGIWANEDEGIANARRIVACVNACAGIGTDILEKVDDNGGILRAADTVASEITKRLQAEARADAAEALLDESRGHIAELLGLVRNAQERLCEYLTPDGSNDDREAMNDLLYMFDGPEQRTIENPARVFLAEAAPKPVRLGDEGEG